MMLRRFSSVIVVEKEKGTYCSSSPKSRILGLDDMFLEELWKQFGLKMGSNIFLEEDKNGFVVGCENKGEARQGSRRSVPFICNK